MKVSTNSTNQLLEENQNINKKTIWEICNVEHIFSEKDISAIYSSPRIKPSMIDLLYSYYEKKGVKNKYDYNEIDVISDFHLFNLAFARDELLLKDEQVAVFLNIFACLLIFDTNNNISDKERIDKKIKELSEHLDKLSINDPPQKINYFNEDQVRRILNYGKENYFRFFSLYSAVFTRKQSCTTKIIKLTIDPPPLIPKLTEALYLGQDKINIDEELLPPKPKKEKIIEEKKEIPEKKEEDQSKKNVIQGIKVDEKTQLLIDSKIHTVLLNVDETSKRHNETIKKALEESKMEVKKVLKK